MNSGGESFSLKSHLVNSVSQCLDDPSGKLNLSLKIIQIRIRGFLQAWEVIIGKIIGQEDLTLKCQVVALGHTTNKSHLLFKFHLDFLEVICNFCRN